MKNKIDVLVLMRVTRFSNYIYKPYNLFLLQDEERKEVVEVEVDMEAAAVAMAVEVEVVKVAARR